MELVFHSTDKFEKDLKRFQEKEKRKIIEKINHYTSSGESNFYRHAYKPMKIFLKSKEESTLYVLRIDRDIRVILTYDEDPLFDQIMITLMRVIRHSQLDKAFKGIAESIYQEDISSFEGNKNG